MESVTYTVYVLYSDLYDKIYIGYTTNLEQRFRSHNELGKKGWTVNFRPWRLVYTEIFETKSQALLREKALKGSQGRTWIRNSVLPK